MPRLSFKPDASFFRKIVVGAVGARAVVDDMAARGHHFVELERGSTDTKLWKDVKRKRVRIPDLVCTKCAQRLECRAKTKLELAMSHSPTDAERAWDYGMVDSDWVAFPQCAAIDESDWANGQLSENLSYWRQRNWVQWRALEKINYFTVEAFRSKLHASSRTKGVEEGSENVIAWKATFSTRHGIVERIDADPPRVSIRRTDDDHLYTWSIRDDQQIVVATRQSVANGEIIACAVSPIARSTMACGNEISDSHMRHLLASRERTLRFTGVKLARLRGAKEFEEEISILANDNEEDVYVRLESISYLVSITGQSAHTLFAPYLDGSDAQNQLEAVIALGEAATPEPIEILSEILDDEHRPYFLRSAAAWSLSRTGSRQANERLIECFAGVDVTLREEALDGLVSIGSGSFSTLLARLLDEDPQIAAGCAEALRRSRNLSKSVIDELIRELESSNPKPWAVWLIGHLPREQFATAIAEVQTRRPDLHYAISLIWSFVDSWISRNWEMHSMLHLPRTI